MRITPPSLLSLTIDSALHNLSHFSDLSPLPDHILCDLFKVFPLHMVYVYFILFLFFIESNELNWLFMDLGFLMPWLDLFLLLAADRNHCRSVETIEPRINGCFEIYGYAFIFKSRLR